VQKLTVHDTPEQNGVAEVLNCIGLERTRAILHASGLPKFLWGEALRHVVWLKNRTSTVAVTSKTPIKVVTGKKPNLAKLPEWGCVVWVHTKSNSKLDGRTVEGRWVGFDEQSKGHRIFWPGKRSVAVELSVTFTKPLVSVDELEGEDDIRDSTDKFSSTSNIPTNTPSDDEPAPVTLPQPASIPVPDAPRISRIRKPSQYVRDLRDSGTASGWANCNTIPKGLQAPNITESVNEDVEEITLLVEAGNVEPLEPKSLAEAKCHPDWPKWELAIREELKMLENAGTWALVSAPPDANIVGSKWVFRLKHDVAGNIVCYKARLVAQGFSQVEGVDYFDTYAPVAKLASICTVLALAARLDLELHQIDIKGAYLNGVLTDDEIIYMWQPPAYHYLNSTGKVLRLHKTIYDLKQSGRRWYQRLTEICTKLGFTWCSVDQAVFYHRDAKSMAVMVVHVDDCMIAVSPPELVVEVKEEMGK
jgi:hypothetical protein